MIPSETSIPMTFGSEHTNPLSLRRLTVGFIDDAPLKCAGIRRDPPIFKIIPTNHGVNMIQKNLMEILQIITSLPVPKGAPPAPTSAPVPLLLPPGLNLLL